MVKRLLQALDYPNADNVNVNGALLLFQKAFTLFSIFQMKIICGRRLSGWKKRN